jgi:hypothetical protein
MKYGWLFLTHLSDLKVSSSQGIFQALLPGSRCPNTAAPELDSDMLSIIAFISSSNVDGIITLFAAI